MRNKYTEGFEEIDRTLRDLPGKIQKAAIQAAARKAARGIIRNARAALLAAPEQLDQDGQSKVAYIARNIKSITLKSMHSMGIYVSVKGSDLPVGDRYWNAMAYAVLLGEGSYRSGSRKTRGSGANRGKFKGFGNFIQKGADMAGNEPMRIFLEEIDTEINKALKRAMK